MKVYRIEKNKNDGVWYDKNQKYICENDILKTFPMPKQDNVYLSIYKSAGRSLDILLSFIPKEVQVELKKKGYVLAEYDTDDYFVKYYNGVEEICFNKTNYKERKVLKWRIKI